MTRPYCPYAQLYANKVGPYANTHETYQYYTEPFCAPAAGKEYKTEGLGEVLEGDRLVCSMSFTCHMKLRTAQILARC